MGGNGLTGSFALLGTTLTSYVYILGDRAASACSLLRS